MTLRKRKIILWSTVGVLAAVLLFFWGRTIPERVQNFSGQDFFDIHLPEFKMPDLPELNLERLNEQETSTSTTE